MKYILKMLSQPSSWAGLSGIALSVGIGAPLYAHVAALGAAVAGMVAFFVNGQKDA